MAGIGLPGADLIEQGLADLRPGRSDTIADLLVAIGAPRLPRTGIDVPPPPSRPSSPELALYRTLAAGSGDDALSQYNALIRRLVSFERALASSKPRRPRDTPDVELCRGRLRALPPPPSPTPQRPSPAGGCTHDAAGDNFVVDTSALYTRVGSSARG